MEHFTHVIDAMRIHPWLGVAAAAAALGIAFMLLRKPRIQRDADARLSALRRDKTDQYTKLRPPR